LSIAKLITALAGLMLLRAALYALPMSRGLPLIAYIVFDILTWTIFIALLISFGWLVRQQLLILLPRFPDGGNIAFLVSVLLAVIVGYPAYYQFIPQGLSWLYALFLLVVALGALGGIVFLIYRNIDKVIASFSSMSEAGHETTAVEPPAGQRCHQCAAPYEEGEKFCAECGSPLSTE
jgi:hypothetical protein